MKISTKGRYALRMAVYLAKHQCDEYVSLKAIAESEDISKKYLEQIVPMLNRAGLLRTTRGNKGGYLLTVSLCRILPIVTETAMITVYRQPLFS